MKSSLEKYMPKQMDTFAIKRSGWIDDGILVVSVDEKKLTAKERAEVEWIGIKLYGERKDNGNST